MSSRKATFGLILILLGVILLFRTFDLIYFSFGDFIRILVPLSLIALGVWLIIRRRREELRQEASMRFHAAAGATETDSDTSQSSSSFSGSGPSADQQSSGPYAGHVYTEAPHYEDNRIRYSKFLGDMFIDCSQINMQNVEISAFIGDVEIKLHGALLSPGLNRLIISGFLGDVRILVPTDMAVFANCSSFVGDIEVFNRRSSGFGNNIDGQTANYRDAEAKLYIAANSFVGDIRVYLV
jgi:lia operon protein LiaF